ncbi:hypothetical protein THRCLA_21205 [Thraustotheca clavata]|uniref:Uncharacterized protein n=1 Tax=Thraustotheca clavata TaxID=74557 RepID=A0A1V9ZYY7_9STRA|nr:hypothetical protein THRCLA_21205 [Thraustotheca clavata]
MVQRRTLSSSFQTQRSLLETWFSSIALITQLGGKNACTYPNCLNNSKSLGLCWTQGGGKFMSFELLKTSLSRGLCWAHGRGKRCLVVGCSRTAYSRNGDRCDYHKDFPLN